MGRLDQAATEGIPDAFGVPSYFVTTFFAEAAGGGCVRLYGCATINGVVMPQYIAVIPIEAVLSGSQMLQSKALAVMHGDVIGVH